MRRREYLKTASVASLGTVTGMAGCLGGVGGSEWSPTIALAAPSSGPLGVLGGPVIEGGKIAVEEVNENSDREIDWAVADTAGNPEDALSVARDMHDDGVVVLSNMIVSDVGLAIRDWAEDQEYPCMGTFVGNVNITKPGTNYFFRLYSNNMQSSAGVIQFYNENDVTDLAIISLNDSYGRAMTNHMTTFAEQVGINVHHAANLPPGTTNFRPELGQIDNDAIGGIAIPYHGQGQVSLTEQLREAGLFEDNLVLGDTAWGAISVYKNPAGATAAGLNFWGVDLRTEGSRSVASRARERFGGETGTYRIVGYDTAKITAQAVANADEVTPQAVRDELARTQYQAVGGWPVEFDDSGDNDAWQLLVNRWEESGDGIASSDPIFKSDSIPGDDPGSILG